MMSRSLPSYDPKMEFAKLQRGLKAVVTFIDCFSAETVKSYFCSQECRLQEAGGWGQVCKSSQLHSPASPPAVYASTGLPENRTQVGEFFHPVIEFILTV